MTHTIAVDNVTYDTLKNLAESEGRTIVGQLRFILREFFENGEEGETLKSDGRSAPTKSTSELQQLIDRLQYFDEDAPEYQEALSRIKELQK